MATYYGASDIDEMLAEFGAPVRITVLGEEHEVRGLLDIADEELLRELGQATTIVGKVRVLTLRTGALPGVVQGAVLEVDEESGTVTRTVVATRQVDDGALTRVFVS